MALTKRASVSTLHFLTRLAGLTGLLVGAAALVAWSLGDEEWTLYLGVAAGALVALGLLGEVRTVFQGLRSQRGAVGTNVALQVLLAAALVAGVNAFSFFNHLRWDWTRDGEFTLPASVRDQLASLEGDTRIVVYRRHSSVGRAGEKQDHYDAAAQRKIVEKVRDLVEQFSELGPRFKVETLDVQQRDYEQRLKAIRKESPELAKAITEAPEDSIFFAADKGVQRLNFNDVYQLDRAASESADGGRGNLVLRYQGVGSFARRVLNIDEKRPRVAFAVVHEVLGLGSKKEEYGAHGARRVLAARGFDTRDIVLKQGWEQGMPSPVVLTFDETRFEKVENRLEVLDRSIALHEKELARIPKERQFWSQPLSVINQKLAIVIYQGRRFAVSREEIPELKKELGPLMRVTPVDEQWKREVLEEDLPSEYTLHDRLLQLERKERAEALAERAGLNVEDMAEKRRIQDLHAKFNRMLADCDLLILPRMTLRDVTQRGVNINNRAHSLDPAQLAAVKDFLKAGKPVLVCLGPSGQPEPPFMPPGQERDQLESTLAALGFRLPDQTVLFNVESKAFAEQVGGLVFLGQDVDVPPVKFDTLPARQREGTGGRDLPALRESLRLNTLGVAADDKLALRLKHPRPVYFAGEDGGKGSRAGTFIITSPDAWNTEDPHPTEKGPPQFVRPKPGDPTRGTIKERRQDRFPVAVAAEMTVPVSWYEGTEGKPAQARVAVIGHGGVFVGQSLNPSQERLLLDTCNWLLGRDDRLARRTDDEGNSIPDWQYPRVHLTEEENALWQWGARLGLPLLFVYLGCVMWMVRRMR